VVAVDFASLGSASGGTELIEELNVCFVVFRPLRWQVVLVVNRLNWANWLASAAVHALVWVDVKHAVALVNTVDRAFLDAGFVFHVYTWQSDNVSH
jgi:hypothetical protein